MSEFDQTIAKSRESILESNKVIKNTYLLLSIAFAISAAFSWFSVALLPLKTAHTVGLVAFGGVIIMLWFVIPRFEESSGVGGLISVFVFTALFGLAIGPTLNYYLITYTNGAQLVATALGGTAMIFFGLSAYALTTKKDFSFLAGFIMVGFIVLLGAVILSLFFNYSAFQLAISAGFILISSAYILWQTSALIHGGETNYIRATVGLFVQIANLFLSLLHILSALAGDR